MRNLLASLMFGVLLQAGCQTANHTEAGALTGAALGTFAGAVIGSQSNHGAEGALIGAATGALAGGVIGNAEDAREERDAAIAHANAVSMAQQQAANPPLSNLDLIRLAQADVSDQVIINTVKSNGGSFDLSTDGLIELKSNGVSDRVIAAVQSAGSAPTTTTVSAATPVTTTRVVVPSSRIVVVPPRPRVGVGVVIGPRRVAPRRHVHWHVWH